MIKAASFLEGMVPGSAILEGKVFQPVARYYPAMDFLLYLREDCSYVADRVSIFLTVLWHPQEERLVGVKLKGFKFLFNHLRNIASLKDTDFLSLVKAVELAFVSGVGEAFVDELQMERLKEMYEKARELSEGVELPPEEWHKAA